jgi:hypothetical protein
MAKLSLQARILLMKSLAGKPQKVALASGNQGEGELVPC